MVLVPPSLASPWWCRHATSFVHWCLCTGNNSLPTCQRCLSVCDWIDWKGHFVQNVAIGNQAFTWLSVWRHHAHKCSSWHHGRHGSAWNPCGFKQISGLCHCKNGRSTGFRDCLEKLGAKNLGIDGWKLMCLWMISAFQECTQLNLLLPLSVRNTKRPQRNGIGGYQRLCPIKSGCILLSCVCVFVPPCQIPIKSCPVERTHAPKTNCGQQHDEPYNSQVHGHSFGFVDELIKFRSGSTEKTVGYYLVVVHFD